MERVDLGDVEKVLEKTPDFIVIKLLKWAQQVEMLGIREVRKYQGYHDEPLVGKRKGERSIRLSRAYRAIYIEKNTLEIKIIRVIEVHKHNY